MKKILSLILAVLLLFTIASPCLAAEATVDEIDAALIERGYPASVLDNLDPVQKQDIYNDEDLIYLDSFSLSYSESSTNTDNSTIQPYGQISTSDLELWFVLSMTTDADNLLNELSVHFYYEWLNMPIFRFQDPIAVSWDSNKFRLLDDSFEKTDMFSGYFLDPLNNYNIIQINDYVQSNEEGYASASPSGVSWYADLASPVGITVTELYGYGKFTLVAAHDTTVSLGTTSTLYAHYVHPTVSIGASIDVPSFGSFSVSGGGAYDERGTQRTFTIERRAV